MLFKPFLSIDQIENELFETDVLDDIHAGAILEIVTLKAAHTGPKRKNSIPSSLSSSIPSFTCRYFYHFNKDQSLEPIQHFTKNAILDRGSSISYYDYAYNDSDQDMDSFSIEFSDSYSIAARRLHVSVLPNFMSCRNRYLQFCCCFCYFLNSINCVFSSPCSPL